MPQYNFGDFSVGGFDQVRVYDSLPDASPFQQILIGGGFGQGAGSLVLDARPLTTWLVWRATSAPGQREQPPSPTSGTSSALRC